MTAILIATLSLLRGDARILARLPRWMAPTGHFILYGVFACLLTLVLQFAEIATTYRALAGFLLATGFGAAMEYAQKFRPGRHARAGDVFIDAAGATAGAVLAMVWPVPVG